MSSCKYSHPELRDVINDLTDAYNTLRVYLEMSGGEADIEDQLRVYINQLMESSDER